MPSAMKFNVRRDNAGDKAPHRLDRGTPSSTLAHSDGRRALQARPDAPRTVTARRPGRVDGWYATWRRKEVDNRRERAP